MPPLSLRPNPGQDCLTQALTSPQQAPVVFQQHFASLPLPSQRHASACRMLDSLCNMNTLDIDARLPVHTALADALAQKDARFGRALRLPRVCGFVQEVARAQVDDLASRTELSADMQKILRGIVAQFLTRWPLTTYAALAHATHLDLPAMGVLAGSCYRRVHQRVAHVQAGMLAGCMHLQQYPEKIEPPLSRAQKSRFRRVQEVVQRSGFADAARLLHESQVLGDGELAQKKLLVVQKCIADAWLKNTELQELESMFGSAQGPELGAMLQFVERDLTEAVSHPYIAALMVEISSDFFEDEPT